MPESMNIIMITGDRFAVYAAVSGLCLAGRVGRPEPPRFEPAELIGPAVAGPVR